MKSKQIENCKITDVTISMEDHGVLTFLIFIEGNAWGCGIGQYVIGHGHLGSEYWDANGSGLVAIMKIMDVVGVSRWEDLKGKYIRVESDGWGSSITKIGHIIKDKWFDLKEFFKNYSDDSKLTVLDERKKKSEEF